MPIRRKTLTVKIRNISSQQTLVTATFLHPTTSLLSLMLNPNSIIKLNNQFWPSSKQCWLRVIKTLALTLLLSLHKLFKTMPLLSPLLQILQIINV